MRILVGWITALSCLAIALLLAAMIYQSAHTHSAPAPSTTYQAILLSNGQAFFGRIEHLETDHPVMRDVFYIQSRVNQETQQVTNILVKRGGEWHAPDHLILNKQNIVFVEPVKEDSQVARLIADQNKQQP